MGTTLDEAYERLHATGPEWGGNLSNHGPMAAEVLARRGHAADVPRWVDAYLPRLDELPATREAITDATWQRALGDGTRIGDWRAYLARQVADHPWRDVLVTWWPRLLPGIAAGATHGVIRTGHAVRTLSSGDESDAAVAELGYALGYWAARSTTVPGVCEPDGRLDPGTALAGVPHLADQSGPIAGRLARLGELAGWPESVAALSDVADAAAAQARVLDLVDAATLRYLSYGYGSPVLLVHTATAPNTRCCTCCRCCPARCGRPASAPCGRRARQSRRAMRPRLRAMRVHPHRPARTTPSSKPSHKGTSM